MDDVKFFLGILLTNIRRLHQFTKFVKFSSRKDFLIHGEFRTEAKKSQPNFFTRIGTRPIARQYPRPFGGNRSGKWIRPD